MKVFGLGWSGVDLFFVLSGYLITSRLLDSRNTSSYFWRFYKNRILRIFPLYYLVLITFLVAILTLPKNQHLVTLSYYTQHWAGFFFFFQNWIMIFFGQPKEQYLIHFWSLALEEQFYIVWPLIIALFGDNKKLLKILPAIICAAIIMRLSIYFYYPHNWQYAFNYFYNSFCRMDTFIIGAIISIAHQQKIVLTEKILNYLLISSFFLVLSGILVFRDLSFFSPFFSTFGYTIVAVLYAVILIKSLIEHSILHKKLKNPFFLFCGKISYGLYIFHWPILLIFNTRMYNWLSAHLVAPLLLVRFFCAGVCLILTFVVSWLSYIYFESYFLRLKYAHN